MSSSHSYPLSNMVNAWAYKIPQEIFASVNCSTSVWITFQMEQLNSRIVNPFKCLSDWTGLSTKAFDKAWWDLFSFTLRINVCHGTILGLKGFCYCGTTIKTCGCSSLFVTVYVTKLNIDTNSGVHVTSCLKIVDTFLKLTEWTGFWFQIPFIMNIIQRLY